MRHIRGPRAGPGRRDQGHGQGSRQHSRMGPDRPRQPIVRDQNRRLTAAAGATDPATERNPARKAAVSCICLVFVCFGDERFRWTVCQGCRYGPSKHSYAPRA